MKPAANLKEIVPGLWAWSSLHEEGNVDFCSCAWRDKDRLVLVDPRSGKDPKQNRESVRRLLGLAVATMTFAHGDPIVDLPFLREGVATRPFAAYDRAGDNYDHEFRYWIYSRR